MKKNKRPSALSMKILERVYTDDILDDIIEKYNGGKIRIGNHYYEPSREDIQQYKVHIFEGKPFSDIAKKLGVSIYCVTCRFARIGIMAAKGDIKL